MEIIAIVMAAGQSKRFNGVKQLAQITPTELLINKVLACWMRSGFSKVIVCLGANRDKIRPQLISGPEIINIDNWNKGIGHNIGYAVSNINCQHVHIAIGLADQIGVTVDALVGLRQLSIVNQSHIVASQYDTTLGVPAIFPPSYQNKLKQLKGDNGAKSILLSERDKIICNLNADASCDIDTRADLINWQKCNVTSQTS